MHVLFAISTDEIDVDIEDMRAFTFLFFTEGDQAVPIPDIQQVAHLPGPARVHALPDNQKRSVLNVGLLKIDRGCGRQQLGTALFGANLLHRFDRQSQMRRGRTATATNNIYTEVTGKRSEERRVGKECRSRW